MDNLLRTNRAAFELFRYGYETGLAHSINHEHLARIIRAMELNYGEIKDHMKSTVDFVDVQAHRDRSRTNNTNLRRSAA